MGRVTLSGWLFLLVVATATQALAASMATYDVRFDATWSAATHPGSFPMGAHFSRLVGGTHNADVSFWQEGELASNGIEQMAERGQTSPLLSELATATSAGTARTSILGFNFQTLPNSNSLTFDVYDTHPLVTLVTMIAPSPDWFVGVSSLPLRDTENWRGQFVVDLWAYDSGTDSGTDFSSADIDTDPAEPLHLINGSPFGGLPKLGTFTFTIQPGTVAGDFDLDGDADVDDMQIWHTGYSKFPDGGAFVTDGDADGDGDVDGADFLVWQRASEGTIVSPVAIAVPEPATVGLAAVGVLFFTSRRGKKRGYGSMLN